MTRLPIKGPLSMVYFRKSWESDFQIGIINNSVTYHRVLRYNTIGIPMVNIYRSYVVILLRRSNGNICKTVQTSQSIPFIQLCPNFRMQLSIGIQLPMTKMISSLYEPG